MARTLSSRNRPALPPSKRRNFGIVAHVDAGKTTTSERILFFTGLTHKIGEVHEGAATMDYLEEERARGITITSAATTCSWADHTLNLIDTPGHIDFTIEVERSLRVLDGAVGVFCSVGGVEPQSETVWRQAERYGVPRMAFINKIDRPGADFLAVGKQIRDKLHATPLVINAPVGEGADFKGILDIVEQCVWVFKPDPKVVSLMEKQDVPDDQKERLAEYRALMFEKLANVDETIMEAYIEETLDQVPLPLIKKAIRQGTMERKITPLLCGSALKSVGIRLLLNAIVDYLPAPEDHAPVDGIDPESGEELLRARSSEAPTAMLAFKTISEPTGDLTFFRLYSGRIDSETQLLNVRTGKSQKVGRLLRMHANKREPIDAAEAGQIFAVLGLKDVVTGDTLCDTRHPIALESMTFPEPVITMAVEPGSNNDRDKLAKALSRIAKEDPSFRRYTDEATGETIIGGMGELHLEIIINRIRNDFKCEVKTGKPQVAYRQILRKPITIESRYIKQTGGGGQYAVAKIEFEPAPEVDGLEYVNEITGGIIPKEYIPSIERGLREEMTNGGELRYPIVGLRAKLIDGKYHDVDSSDKAFQACGRQALRMVMEEAGMDLLEPMLLLHVSCPEDTQGNVLGDLSQRRAQPEEITSERGFTRIKAIVPAAEMFAYNTALMSMTQGKGQASPEPHSYATVPHQIAEGVRKRRKEQLYGTKAGG